jgi:hypothetical protein
MTHEVEPTQQSRRDTSADLEFNWILPDSPSHIARENGSVAPRVPATSGRTVGNQLAADLLGKNLSRCLVSRLHNKRQAKSQSVPTDNIFPWIRLNGLLQTVVDIVLSCYLTHANRHVLAIGFQALC